MIRDGGMEMKQDGLSNSVIEGAKNYCADYARVNQGRLEQMVLGLLDLGRAEYQVSSIEEDLSIALDKSYRMLEVGSGLGSFLMAVRKTGVDCYGIEPNEHGAMVAVKRMPGLKERIGIGVAEHLPYSNESFDIVVSFQVLEHTQSPARALKESTRVLRKGGFLYFVVPNYNSFWEGHYGLYWLPLFPKRLAKLYVRLRRRDPQFLDSIQYVTPRMISTVLAQENIEIVSMGLEKWENRLDSIDLPTWGNTEKLLQVAKLSHKLGLTGLVKFLGRRLSFYYPIILIARKI